MTEFQFVYATKNASMEWCWKIGRRRSAAAAGGTVECATDDGSFHDEHAHVGWCRWNSRSNGIQAHATHGPNVCQFDGSDGRHDSALCGIAAYECKMIEFILEVFG